MKCYHYIVYCIYSLKAYVRKECSIERFILNMIRNIPQNIHFQYKLYELYMLYSSDVASSKTTILRKMMANVPQHIKTTRILK